MKRRDFLLSAGTTGLLASCHVNPKNPEQKRLKNVVLVHGAWHGGWCWDLVKAQLQSKGFQVIAPTLSGLGERANELSEAVTLETHINDTLLAIEAVGFERFVLVGHSYGGMVITGVADALRERIDHVIYLDAAVPENGDSMVSVGPDKSLEILEASRAGLLALSQDGGISMSPLPPEAFGIPADHPKRDWVEANLSPHPLRTWFAPIVLRQYGSDGLDRTYVHCTEPALPQSSFPYFAEVAQSSDTWRYIDLPTGHDAMITAPDAVTQIIVEASIGASRMVGNDV